jgi:general secretion pathway protein D
VNVLSTPEVLAANNREARILVGSKVPFIAAQRLANDVALDRAVQYQDVGTALTIVPTINDDGYVTLRILQEVSALTQQTIAAALGAPVITTREAETSAIVRHGQTIVIGGLIDDTRDVLDSGIPILRDIPLLGALFRTRTSGRTRSELAIFLTPYVVFTDAEAQELMERERGRLRELQREAPGVPIPAPTPPRRRP